ncbi:hypothetical protein CTKZ_01740 [Cellulomonas algicola]|uniref:Uncharacterized protein n=1 Tax=Cellulomonas algicola TaxID=2071633 RepID=A0A401UVH4_9CELL|nr:hypothetical protein [Cellulomonas algicola]GCD18612.1 hypothetical protein CTKZ_01740 [Cellulomonas algicola]
MGSTPSLPTGAWSSGPDAVCDARRRRDVPRVRPDQARLLDGQPGLLQLRTLQAVEAGGATVVLSADPATTAAARATS